MNKKCIALLFSLMAATAPTATFAESKETTQTETSTNPHVKEIFVVIGAVAIIAVIGGGTYVGLNRNKKRRQLWSDEDGLYETVERARNRRQEIQKDPNL